MTLLSSFFKHRYFGFFVVLLLFLLAELIICPVDSFPINDDWSYAYTVKHLTETGTFDLGYWPAMTLVSHVLWGKLFVSIFGFSHFVLRCSTLFLAVFSLFLFYRLVLLFSKNRLIPFLSCLLLLFNPFFFSLANSFMTDVPFIFSVVLALYCAEKILVQQKNIYILWFSLVCIYSLLIRQFGLLLPAALLVVACIMALTEKRSLKQMVLYCLPFLSSLICYLVFEKWVIHHLPPASAYQSAGSLTTNPSEVISGVLGTVTVRYSYLVLYIGLFLCPFCVLAAISIFRSKPRMNFFIALPIAIVFAVIGLNRITIFPTENVFFNFGLGAELLYDTGILSPKQHHLETTWFTFLVWPLAVCGMISIAFVAASGLVGFVFKIFRKQPINKLRLFLVLFSLAYFLMLCVFKTFTDRYSLPLIGISLFLLLPYIHLTKISLGVSAVFIALMAYFSVFATSDYFNWNRVRWQLISTAKEQGIKPDELNGGFEHVASTFYHQQWWGLWAGENTPYKITFRPVPKHDLVKYITYQRCIPYQTDTIFLLHKQ